MLQKQMISPITGKMMPLLWEKREMFFRKEAFCVMFPYYKCLDSGEQFTTTESDGVWYQQLTNQYCSKYYIPFQDEIISIREKYGLSAAAMSKILGFGPNQWRRYEQEEVPNVSNGRMIRSIMNPKVMLDMVKIAHGSLDEKEYERLVGKVSSIIGQSKQYHINQYETNRVYANSRSELNGYGQLSLERLKNVMLYILEHCDEVWTTKMNKLLFYIDFSAYRDHGMAITGLSYRAIGYGPVPERWERVYSQFDEIRQETKLIGDYEGNVIVSQAKSDETLFTKDELQIMNNVCSCLGKLTSRQLSELSHQEKGWIAGREQHNIIPFSDAFALKAI